MQLRGTQHLDAFTSVAPPLVAFAWRSLVTRSSSCAQDVITALDTDGQEAERLQGPLATPLSLVSGNGSCLLVKRFREHITERT